MSKWTHGAVALVECSDGEWRHALYDERPRWSNWRFADGMVRDAGLSSARRVAVIDLENREQVERLYRLAKKALVFVAMDQTGAARQQELFTDALREFANPTPPKPDEPQGLGAVVECEDGATWVRADLHLVNNWVRAGFGQRGSWSSVSAVRVLSEGVPSD